MYSKLQNFQLIFFLLESLHSESLPPLPRDYIWETWQKGDNSNWMLWIQLNSVVFHLRMPPLLATLCVSGPFHFAPCFIDTVHSANLRTVHTCEHQCTVHSFTSPPALSPGGGNAQLDILQIGKKTRSPGIILNKQQEKITTGYFYYFLLRK